MANEMIRFLRGNVANLPQTATEGALYFTKDEGIYLGMADGSYHRYGDFITVADVNSLPTTGAHETCMYYCIQENILAKYDSTKGAWVQINKQPTAEEMKTLLGLGGLAYLSEVSEDNLNSALKEKVNAAAEGNHAHLNKSELDKVADGDVEKWGAAYAHSLVDHAPANAQENKIESIRVNNELIEIKNKCVDITVPTGALAGKDEVAKTDLAEALANEIDAKVASVAEGDKSITIGGTATAPTVAVKISAAEGNALELTDDGLKVIIPESTKVEASETNGNIKVDGEEVTVYTHPDKHAIDDVTGLQDALDGKSDDGHKHVKADITDFDHNHEMSEVNGLEDALAGKQDVIPENTYDAYGSAATALTDAKAYVDKQDIFQNDTALVNAHGGLQVGDKVNGMTTHQILEAILFPYVAFTLDSTSRNAAAKTLEKGDTQTLSSASITITKKSKPITSVKLLNGSTVLGEKTGDDVAAGGTIKIDGFTAITVSKSNNPNLKFTVTDGTTSTDKSVGASTFVYPFYWGECAADATIDEALIESLTKKIETKASKTVTHTMNNGRMVFAYPNDPTSNDSKYGDLKSILDPNNFETIGDYTKYTVNITGKDGVSVPYNVYVSGAATVSGFKVQYKF